MSKKDTESTRAEAEPIERSLSVREAAEILGVSVYTIYQLVEREQIAHFRVGKLIRFRRRHLEEYMDANYNGVKN